MTTVYATRFPSGDAATPPTDLNRDRSLLTSPCGFAAAARPSELLATTTVRALMPQLKHLDTRIRHRLLSSSQTDFARPTEAPGAGWARSQCIGARTNSRVALTERMVSARFEGML